MTRILLVDDEKAIRNTLKEILEYEKYEVDEAQNGMECLVKIKKNKYDLVLLDIKMPKLDGIEALERIQEIQPDLPVLMVSGHANIDTAVEAVKKGAYDFIQKPPDLNRLLITIKNGLDRSHLVKEKKALQSKLKGKKRTPEIVGESEAIKHIKANIDKVAPTAARVMITGSNGTGKELVARWIHEKSERSDHPLIEVNCAAIPSELIESELFGHVKGAFTSAVKDHSGVFEQAHGGTLFLDEIGDMSLSAQAKVLRALQENKITPVGGRKSVQVNVRVIAATNKDLSKEIAAGRFREDLYHRLAVILIQVPALSDRLDDIPLIATHFVKKICQEQGIPEKKITKEAYEVMKTHSWTGNIRELRNVVERLIIMCEDSITAEDVMNNLRPMGYNRKVNELMKEASFANLGAGLTDDQVKEIMSRALDMYRSDKG